MHRAPLSLAEDRTKVPFTSARLLFIVAAVSAIRTPPRFATPRRATRLLRCVEVICWAGGLAACLFFALAKADSVIGSREDLVKFAQQLEAPDQALWSAARIRDYRTALATPMGAPVAVLTIPAVNLQVPVYSHATELSLNRGTGLIEGMALPDRGGNVGIAGHRDGFFRVLKDIHKGDLIEVRTRLRLHRYRVTLIEIVDQSDAHPLADTELPAVTLVTCYPFYYLGNAPQRFIVSATYEWSSTHPPGST